MKEEVKKIMKKENTEIVVIARQDAIPGKFFPELEVLKPAEVGIGYHGSYKIKNATIKEIYSHFNAVGPGSDRVSRVVVAIKELEETAKNKWSFKKTGWQ